MLLRLPWEQGALTQRLLQGEQGGDWSQHSKGDQDPGVCSVLISFQPTFYWQTGEKAVNSSLKSNNFS